MKKKKIEVEVNDLSELNAEELEEKTEEVMGMFVAKMVKFQNAKIGSESDWRELGELFLNVAECLKESDEKTEGSNEN